MRNLSPRIPLCRLLRWAMVRRASDASDGLPRSAIVFSPHFDDETLGCGGTILRKRKAGAKVRIVFMTDGSKSHERLISPGELSAIRKAEALAAAEALGLIESDVTFLDFEERRLAEHRSAAMERAAAVLEQVRPEQVFVPYRYDGKPDHEVTSEIVLSILRHLRVRVQVLEYPIWFWFQWPWCRLMPGARRRTWEMVTRSARSGPRMWGLAEFRTRMDIGEVLHRKRAVLQRYSSQMTRLRHGSRWPVLADFMQPYELFKCYVLSPDEHKPWFKGEAESKKADAAHGT